MNPTLNKSIKPRDIKDHTDLVTAFEQLNRAVAQEVCFDWDNTERITYLKAEIAHFLRMESPHAGVVCGDREGPFAKAGSVDNNVRKHSNNPHL